jgi:hypothetical protein
MIDDVRKSMTDISVLLGRVQMTESGLYGTWREEWEVQCVTVVALDDCHFFLFPKMKKRNIGRKRERQGEKERKKEMEEVLLVLQTMTLYVSVYMTCLQQSLQSQAKSKREGWSIWKYE